MTGWSSHGQVTLATTGHAGARAARMDGEAGWRRVITVKPYTRYTLRAWLRSLAGTTTMLGVKDYGAHQLIHMTNATAYTQRALTFTTGNVTSLLVFAYQASGSSLVGDFVLVESP